jgi:hypothetical protein
MMNSNWKDAVAVVAVLLMAQAASAQGRGNGKPARAGEGKAAGEGKGAKEKSVTVSVVVDRDGDRRVVREYFRQQSLPPGLAKKDLPPGLAKQLRERGQLPPGLEKHMVEVPASLHARMPPLPPSHHRYFVGGDMIVVDLSNKVVIAVVGDLF